MVLIWVDARQRGVLNGVAVWGILLGVSSSGGGVARSLQVVESAIIDSIYSRSIVVSAVCSIAHIFDELTTSNPLFVY